MTDRTLARVQFRFVLGEIRSYETSKTFFVYKEKWSKFMKYVLDRRNYVNEVSLSEVRKLIPKDISVIDIINNYSDNLDPHGLEMLVSAQPLFNLSPKDLKVFILVALGLKPSIVRNA